MVEGRDRQNWNYISCLASIIVNISGNLKKGTNITANHFNPYYKKDQEAIDPKVTWQMMEKMFDKTNRRKKKNAFPKDGGVAVSSCPPLSTNKEKEVNNE
jgi:hypothetical protein